MKTSAKLFLSALLLAGICATECAAQDWPNLNRYRSDNQANLEARRNDPAEAKKTWVVFMGNSITQNWASMDPEFFTSHNYLGRGISGQTSPQMLLRFRQDVIDLSPKAVVILAGTNDIAGNTGPSSVEMIMDNIESMVQLAQANDIEVVLCSVLPAGKYGWRPEVEQVPEKIRELNARLRKYALERGIAWVDYHPALAAEDGSMRTEYTRDGVHPTRAGYDVMEQVIAPALEPYQSTKP